MAENNKNKKQNNKKISSIIAFAVCVIVAFGMWIYVMNVESPKYSQTVSDVTVELTGTDKLAENELAIFSGYGMKIDVTLSGKKSIVSRLAAEDIVVTADLSRIEASGRYSLKTVVDVPVGCKLIGVSQDTVSVYVDRSGQITVDLTEKRENTDLPEGCFTGAIEYDVDKVTVTGPLSMLTKVAEAVVTLDMSGITKTTTVTERITLVDAAGAVVESPYIDYFPKEVIAPVTIMKTARVPVEVKFKNGFLSYDSANVFVDPEFVEVTGDSETVNRGDCILPVVIDEKSAMHGGIYSSVVTIEAEDGLELSAQKAKITVTLKPGYAVREFTVPEENISAKGVGGVKFTWQEAPITVELLGKTEVLARLKPEDIKISFDVSPYSDSNSGDIRIKADVAVPEGDADGVLPVGTYYVNVTFGKEA